jgi:hypothetical protein
MTTPGGWTNISSAAEAQSTDTNVMAPTTPDPDSISSSALFDLNIERVLEHWEVHHALRELIANALDEQVLSGTEDIEIYKDDADRWHVRDFGRGLGIEHFTLNEDEEKLAASGGVIGKFGVGLKDALATLDRHEVGIEIRSPAGTFRVRHASKHGFDEITTLHVEHDHRETGIGGTDVVLTGVRDEDVELAKSLFLRFSAHRVLETTSYGQVLDPGGNVPRVYISGVQASEEENFRFSYNITDLTPAMRKALNRERLNVGRSTYAERVKSILRKCEADEVLEALASEILARRDGRQCDEVQWAEVTQVAIRALHRSSEVVLVTEDQLRDQPHLIDAARRDGYEVVAISSSDQSRLEQDMQRGGEEARTLDVYAREYNESFEYTFVPESALSAQEARILALTPRVFKLLGATWTPRVRVSETMRAELDATLGCWDPQLGEIVIHRRQLRAPAEFLGTLLHEAAHALTGTYDATRDFESVLTQYLGVVAEEALCRSTS